MAGPKVFIPFYSRSGTIERLAKAVAEGAESEGAEVRLRRVRELVDWDVMSSVPGWKESAEAMNARYPAPTPEDAVWADAVIFGTPTRFGNVSSELKAFIDSLGGLWVQGKLVGKAGSVFAGSAQPHGGNESTVISLWNPLAHLGFIIVPTGYADPVMFAGAGSPYGASVISGNPPAGPSETELAVARFQGKRVT
ncbi:MAG TPA: NAD(P)H:quinone oxidoreductase, partial [Rhizomicrobium sp.]|nr:NAD(P)H:quinone oxidoreductase [Rhizomicrobium sp.]